MNKNGFTLGEVAVTVAVIGFLAAIFLPAIKNAMPNQEQLMFKKAYYLTERTVSELINDEILYPEVDSTETNQYFANTEEVTYKGEDYSGDTKFCELFAQRLNRSSSVDCSEKTFTDGSKPSGTFTAADGIVWILPVSSFSSETEAQKIYLDVNGDKKPNCFYDASSCKKPDRFTIKVYQDGRVEADGTMETEYLNRDSIKQEDDDDSSSSSSDNSSDILPPPGIDSSRPGSDVPNQGPPPQPSNGRPS